MIIYEPSDDTYLLLGVIKQYLAQKVQQSIFHILEMGAGSGEISFSLPPQHTIILCVDVNPVAVNYMCTRKEKDMRTNISLLQSDLFENIPQQKFDLIFFNTPYLPDEEIDAETGPVHDIALHGGPNGNEVCLRFLEEAREYLADDGVIFVLVSSLGGAKQVKERALELYGVCEPVASERLFMEELIVYRIAQSGVERSEAHA